MGLLDNFRRQTGQRISMNVCMMGPRGVGKTTILTAVFKETQCAITSTNLLLHAQGTTRATLNDHFHELSFAFDVQNPIVDRPNAGLSASSGEHVFEFAMGLKGKEPKVDLYIKDFPGEYVQTKPQDVTAFISDSNAIMLAIDTPHMMEAGGRYCEEKNKIHTITSFFKNSLSENSLSDKLVLLVPLKCERYQHEGRMGEVLEATERYYAELLRLLIDNKRVCCAITPILTLGGVEFDRFEHSTGNIALPRAYYRFWGNPPVYRSAFCNQPIYYLLSFISEQYQRSKKNAKFFKKIFQAIFSLFDKDPELYEEILKLEKYRKSDFPGYKIVCGESMFYYNR